MVGTSDDFSGFVLDGFWRIEGPGGIGSSLASDADDAWLNLVTPDGGYDIWNSNNTARALQTTADTDFVIGARFLSTPSERYQMQGLLVEQDANNWIRFDTYSDGNVLRAFAAVTVDGASAARISVVIPGGVAPYLRVSREGDLWTMLYSLDGAGWVTAGSFTHAISVASAGVFAGNTAGATGFTAQVDYFETSLDPLTLEDGAAVQGNLAPDAQDDAVTAYTDTPIVIDTADLVANDSDPEGDPVTVTGFTQPDHGTLVDNGDGTWSYTPDTGYTGPDSFSYTITDGDLTDTATVNVTVDTPPEFSSDDFHDGPLAAGWIVTTPIGTSQGLGAEGIESFLSLSTGPGNYDIWNVNNAARAMQIVADEDFGLEARFLSTPTERFQMQGFLIEGDAGNWLRFDTYSDGGQLYAFAAITVNGSSSTAFRTAIAPTAGAQLRIERSGDDFTFAFSEDGETWTTAGTLTHVMTVSQAGVFAGSTGASGGFTAQVDYVQSDADLILTEDGITAPPEPEDDAFSVDLDTDLVLTEADLLANDFEPDGDVMTVVSVSDPDFGSLVDNGDGTFTYQPNAGFQGYDFFTYTVSDGTSTETATVTLTVGTPPLPEFGSDDFHTSSLAGRWDVVLPEGAAYQLSGDADDAFLQITTGSGNYDLWGNTRNAARMMQDVTDEDFTLEARFISTPSQQHQMHGFLIEADESNWLRYDLYSDGGNLYAFAALTENGRTTVVEKERVDVSTQFIRLERVGDTFTFAYSQDGEIWTIAGGRTHQMVVTQTGIFAGSVGAEANLTAQIDYVEAGADPILDEDAGYEPPPAPPVTGADSFSMDPGTTLAFTAADLLANDSDINKDPLTIVAIEDPANGTINDLGGGNYVYTPDVGFEGTETFTYTVSDGTETTVGNVSILVEFFDAVSDDFSGAALAPVWEFEGIAGQAYVGYEGDDAFATIVSPAGVPVSASGTMTTPRILQDVLDLDLQIAAGFLTEPALQYQEHGLLVIQDDKNWIRFDLAFTGSTLTLIVGMIVDGKTTYPLFDSIGYGVVEELRVTREGDDWVFEYRGNGSDWIEAYTYTRAMEVSQVGVFAGSTSFTGEIPGYTAHVDYFENSLQPIVNEDSSYVPQNHAPVANDDAIGVADDVTFSLDDLLANDYDPDVGDTMSVVAIGTPDHGILTNNGDGTYTYVPDEGFEGMDSLTYTVSDGTLTADATLTLDVQEPIDLWYGEVQSFGSPGLGQRAINILGKVSEDVTELAYSLNGGELRSLSIGPDTRRLQENGDFNIDINYTELDGSAADDLVTIYATLDNGAVFSQDVTVEYEADNDWDKNYAIDWENVTNIQDAVLVADGTWSHDANGVRPVDLGYDRLLVLGDQSWDNYELNLSITTHDLQNVDPLGRDGGGFAIGMLWDGHTSGRFAGWQPASGYEPGASFFFTHLFKSHSYHNFSEVLGVDKMSLEEDATYNFTVRVEQVGIYDRLYSLKVWEEGEVEPLDWTLQTTETFSLEEAPATGSLYLNAHYFDVTFGDLTVTEITGNDIIQGDDTNEIMIAADVGSVAPGRDEIDVFVGAGGSDVFVFGDSDGTFYDDGNGATAGQADYGFVWDFEKDIDQVQLAGSAADYILTEDHTGLTAGTAVWHLGTGGDADELVGLLNGVYGLNLTDENFIYDALTA
ncbi:MAG: cadherin-like domain-containing protein [Paracoccaceae bacterium]